MYFIFKFQVSIDIDNQNEWKECLKVTGVRLPTGYFFGASAGAKNMRGIEISISIVRPILIYEH